VYSVPDVVILAAAGDDGYGTEEPAGFEYVVAVGGTELVAEPSQTRAWVENVWWGTGSGCLPANGVYPAPAWQNIAPNNAAGACWPTDTRMMNDSAAVADDVLTFYSGYSSKGNWIPVAGTSISTPLLAGVYGLAGNAGVLGQNAAGRLWNPPAGSLWDVTTGSNATASNNCGGPSTPTFYYCNALVGYDGPTGQGTPNGIKAF
jgi:hypothetical protein